MSPIIQVTYRGLLPEDEWALLKLRNNVSNLNMFTSPSPVSESDHATWFKSRLNTLNSLQTVAVVSRQIIGIAYLTLGEKNSAKVSVNVAPKFQSKGIGYSLLMQVIENAQLCGVVRIDAEIRKENSKSIALFERLGFSRQNVFSDDFHYYSKNNDA